MRKLHACLLTILALAPLGRAAFSTAESAFGWGGIDGRGLRSTDELVDEADALHAQGSFGRALEVYRRAADRDLGEALARHVEFRVLDSHLRSLSKSRRDDKSELIQAEEAMKTFINATERVEDRDDIWIDAHVSLGDRYLGRNSTQNWSKAWQYYHQAFEAWAGSRDIESARGRYLGLLRRISRSLVRDYHYNSMIPISILENAREISVRDKDLAFTSFLIAMHVRNAGGGWVQFKRVPGLFEKALELGPGHDWYDDTLYHYAEWLADRGRVSALPDGGFGQERDYSAALVLYRRIVDEFERGESPYHDNARDRIRSITSPSIDLTVGSAFLPGSPIEFNVSWRNLSEIELQLVPVDLSRDLSWNRGDRVLGSWVEAIDVENRAAAHRLSLETEDDGRHRPGARMMRVASGVLEPGAYLLEARSGSQVARDAVLITDQEVVLSGAGSKALAWVTHALTGEPRSGAQVVLWEMRQVRGRGRWVEQRAVTDEDGVASFDLAGSVGWRGLQCAAVRSDRQSFVSGGSHGPLEPARAYRIHVTSQKPAYRPGEVARLRWVVRKQNGEDWTTPAGETLDWKLYDPRGAELAEGSGPLSAFGSSAAEVDLGDGVALGEYRLQFKTHGDRPQQISSETVFRVEEYKLPEFEVSVTTPEDPESPGRRLSFKAGETVEAEVSAQYYFGAPVAGAQVEVIVTQKQVWIRPRPKREFPWFHDEGQNDPWNAWWIPQNEILRKEIVTDAEGLARFEFPSPDGGQQDYEYTITARVTDASRREVSGSESVRVTRQGHFVFAEVERKIPRPGKTARVNFEVQDPNGEPLAVDATVIVTRQIWEERWEGPDGESRGRDEYRALLRASMGASGSSNPTPWGWRLVRRGYRSEEFLRRPVRSGEDGEAVFEFTASKPGTYRVFWTGADRDGLPVETSAWVWVADEDSSDLGYHTEGLEILLDKDTWTAGEEAVAMIATPSSDRWVLFTVETREVLEHRVLHLDGRIKLVKVPLDERHIPNIYLSALSVAAGRVEEVREEVIVPPVEQFLTVDVGFESDTYEPRDKGVVVVKTRDHHGNPVAAEVGVAVIDASVLAIQGDYSADPRQFFYGTKRGAEVRHHAGTRERRLVRLVKDEEGNWVHGPLLSSAELLDHPGIDPLARDEFGRLTYVQDFDVQTASGSNDFFLGQGSQRAFGSSRDRAALESLGYVADAPAGARESLGRGRFGGRGGGGPASPAASSSPGPDGAVAGAWGDPADSALPGSSVVVVRSDFRSAILWEPVLRTDELGEARIPITFPDSLTRWRAQASAITRRTRVGRGEGSTRTRMPLTIRQQAPRFFVSGDACILSALVNNNGESAMATEVTLELEGGLRTTSPERVRIQLEAGGEARVDWPVDVLAPGPVTVRMIARSSTHSDAEEKPYLAYERGIDRHVITSGRMQGDELDVLVTLPKERRPDSESLVVQLAPSVATTLVDALPYLIDYPYGCVEQTMSRFLPAAIVAGTLEDLGLPREQVVARFFGGITEEGAEATQKRQRASLLELDRVTEQSLERLYDFQHGSGGWGWWKHGSDDRFMSAYVLWGLSLAQEAGIELREGVLDKGVAYLTQELVEVDLEVDVQSFLLHALASARGVGAGGRITPFETQALDNAWDHRGELNAYGQALLALACQGYGQSKRARTLVLDLVDGVQLDRTPDTSVVQRGDQESHGAVIPTAHWGRDGVGYRWSQGKVEATAFCLRALCRIAPDHELVEPTMNWLVRNRRGSSWNNTRDSAISILALCDYLGSSGELEANYDLELTVNGESFARQEIRPENVISAPSLFEIPRDLLVNGENRVGLRRTGGGGAVYFQTHLSYFSREKPIPAAGHELFLRRDYHHKKAVPTLLKGYVHEHRRMADGSHIESGERIEVVLTIEAKNDMTYVLVEDLKPAGFEAVGVRSGTPIQARQLTSRHLGELLEPDPTHGGDALGGPVRLGTPARRHYTGRSVPVHQELRDRKVAHFIDRLDQGLWEIRYELRAEVPGRFAALPVLGEAMYVPEIRANGAEIGIVVEERAD